MFTFCFTDFLLCCLCAFVTYFAVNTIRSKVLRFLRTRAVGHLKLCEDNVTWMMMLLLWVCSIYSWKIVPYSCINTMELSTSIAVTLTLRRPWLSSLRNLMDSLTSMHVTEHIRLHYSVIYILFYWVCHLVWFGTWLCLPLFYYLFCIALLFCLLLFTFSLINYSFLFAVKRILFYCGPSCQLEFMLASVSL